VGISIETILTRVDVPPAAIWNVAETAGVCNPAATTTSRTSAVMLRSMAAIVVVSPSSAIATSCELAAVPGANRRTDGLWVATKTGVNVCPFVRLVMVTL
jgi:hypothetical protein